MVWFLQMYIIEMYGSNWKYQMTNDFVCSKLFCIHLQKSSTMPSF